MKTNFKKLFVSILTCISVVPSANLKIDAVCQFGSNAISGSNTINIYSAQDWLDISDRIYQNHHYTEGKHFVLNNDIVLGNLNEDQYICWSFFNGTLDGNGHKIALNNDIDESLIGQVSLSGEVNNVVFSGDVPIICHNNGLISNCSSTSFTFVGVNQNNGSIQNCDCEGEFVAIDNRGQIANCSLLVDEERITQLQPGIPDEQNQDFDLWNSTDAQHFVISYGNSDNISNCELILQH